MATADASDAPPSALAGTVAADLGLVVAPSTGRFHAAVERGLVDPASVVATVTGGGGRTTPVTVPVAAEVCGLLAIDGQMVSHGQPLAWVRRLDG